MPKAVWINFSLHLLRQSGLCKRSIGLVIGLAVAGVGVAAGSVLPAAWQTFR